MSISNIFNLGIKELRALMRDPMMVLLIVCAFTAAVYIGAKALPETLNNAAISIVDGDQSPLSRSIGSAFPPPYFETPSQITSGEINERMDVGTDAFTLDIPPHFQSDLIAGKSPVIYLDVDATGMTQALIGSAYVQSITSAEISAFTSRHATAALPSVDLALRARFNPALDPTWFGAVMNVINMMTMLAIILAGTSLIRDRERGTLEYLPATRLEIILAKVWSMGAVVFAASLISVIFVVQGLLHMPIEGSLALFMAGAVLQIFAATAIGVALATIAGSMPQFGMLLILVLLPLQVLSGGMTPRTSMPEIVQFIMLAAPSTHFIIMAQAVLSRGAGLAVVWPQFSALLAIAIVLCLFSLGFFRRSLSGPSVRVVPRRAPKRITDIAIAKPLAPPIQPLPQPLPAPQPEPLPKVLLEPQPVSEPSPGPAILPDPKPELLPEPEPELEPLPEPLPVPEPEQSLEIDQSVISGEVLDADDVVETDEVIKADPTILTFNAGEGIVKLDVFRVVDSKPQRIGRARIDFQRRPVTLHLTEGPEVFDAKLATPADGELYKLLGEVFELLTRHFDLSALAAVGHRVIHGGDIFLGPVAIDKLVINQINDLVPLAPLLQPQSLRLIQALRHLRPRLPQTASFDTSFHITNSDLVRRAPPRFLNDTGVKHYGFQGLSFQFVEQQLARIAPQIANRKVIIAHIGSEYSLCGIDGGVSRDTSTSFSMLDGAPMAGRSSPPDTGALSHRQSGLLGVSSISNAGELFRSTTPEAREALELFAFRIAGEAARITNTLGGLEAFVFTGEIGERQPEIRAAIAGHLKWLGLDIDTRANAANAQKIGTGGGRVAAFVLHSDEEQVIATDALDLVNAAS